MDPQTSHQPIPPHADFPPHDDFYQPLNDWSAAEVLASFNEFPIKATQDQRNAAGHLQISHGRGQNDPLSADINHASFNSENGNLPIALGPFLKRSQSRSSADNNASGLSNCPGVSGIGGAMVPGQALNSLYEHLDLPKSRHAASTPASKPLHQASDGSNGRQVQPGRRASDVGSHGNKATSAKKDGAFKTSFQFVVNEDAKQMRNTVRKHVMKEFRRKERWQQDLKKEGEDEAEPGESKTNGKRRKRRSPPTSDSDRSAELTASTSSSDKGQRWEDHSVSKPAVAVPGPKRRRLDSASNEQQLQSWCLAGEDEIYELDRSPTRPYLADPMAAIASSEVDPFSRFKELSSPATESLLHHFAWVMPSLMDEIVAGTVFRRLGWLYANVAIHDPTPVHIIIGFAASHVANLSGKSEPAFATEHKSKAIKLLNQRIEDPAEALSDRTLGAIVHIAAWELIECNAEAFALHMSGIRRIVAARGGTGILNHNPELEVVLIRLDAIRAYIAMSAPRYPAYISVRNLPPLYIPIPSPYSPSAPSLSLQVFEHVYCEDAIHLVHGIEDVLLLMRAGALDVLTPVGAPYKALLSAHVGQLLSPSASHLLAAHIADSVTNAHPTPAATPTTPHTPGLPPNTTRRQRLAARTLRLAALVFVDLTVREFFEEAEPTANGRRRPLGRQTRRILQERFLGDFAPTGSAALWGRSLEMMVAVLLQSDRLALEKPWRGWYFADALTLTMALGAEAWAGVGHVLEAFLREGVERQRREEAMARDTGMMLAGERVDALVRGQPRHRKVWDLEKEFGRAMEAWGAGGA